MQRLLYHAPDNPNQESPFNRAIVQVVQGQVQRQDRLPRTLR